MVYKYILYNMYNFLYMSVAQSELCRHLLLCVCTISTRPSPPHTLLLCMLMHRIIYKTMTWIITRNSSRAPPRGGPRDLATIWCCNALAVLDSRGGRPCNCTSNKVSCSPGDIVIIMSYSFSALSGLLQERYTHLVAFLSCSDAHGDSMI